MSARAFDVIPRAIAAGATLATAESCTAGLIAGALTEVPGSSNAIERGYVTYSNSAKHEMLGVRLDTLETYGAVSEQVAEEMADGARKHADVTVAVAVTGIAGPGGSEFKPEGRVCFGLAGPAGVVTETVDFGPLGRSAVRAATVDHALAMVLKALEDL